MMTFQSILFAKPEDAPQQAAPGEPACFADLNLDQIVASITADRPEYDLAPFFHTALGDIDAIDYRHAVFRDIEKPGLFDAIASFAKKLRTMRSYLEQAEELRSRYQEQRWFAQAVALYCEAVTGLAGGLAELDLQSAGFQAFHDYLSGYAGSDAFATLAAEAQQLERDFCEVEYCVWIKGLSVTVRRYAGEKDYSAVIVDTFDKFRQHDTAATDFKFSDQARMNQVELRILERVVRLFPELFARLDDFCAQHDDYLDGTIARFDREVQFYVAYLHFLTRLKKAGLEFCYPVIGDRDKTIHSTRGFDLALARKLVPDQLPVVTNDFYLQAPERVIVVSGPNQGGKTTFARTFGQLHYLASLGCPVPGDSARLFLFDALFTHFEKEEDIHDLRGKLEDDLVRIHEVLGHATSRSIFIMNEIFSSTTSRDALFLGEKVLARVIDLEALCVCVTFIDELASLSENTVSMASTVEPDNPAIRTYKVIRKPADGLAYALSVAKEYRLTREQLRQRL